MRAQVRLVSAICSFRLSKLVLQRAEHKVYHLSFHKLDNPAFLTENRIIRGMTLSFEVSELAKSESVWRCWYQGGKRSQTTILSFLPLHRL